VRGCGRMGELHILNHPLIQHKLTYIRDKTTGTKQFRELVNEVTMLMGLEITRHLPLTTTTIETQVTTCESNILTGKKIELIRIVRAGVGMVDGMMQLLPAAGVGQIGLYRDPKTLDPVQYYRRLPVDVSERMLVLLGPISAEGGFA